MKAKTFVAIAASTTLVYLGYKLLCGNRLVGSFNSSQSGTNKVTDTVENNDLIRIKLLGNLSNLEAKRDGLIRSDESKEILQEEINKIVVQLRKQ